MNAQSFDNSIETIAVHGRFDAHEVQGVKDEMENHLKTGIKQLVVNLAQVNFMDTRAISLLITMMKRCRERDGDVRLCNLQQSVRIIFELMHLDKAFQIFDSETAAVGSFTR